MITRKCTEFRNIPVPFLLAFAVRGAECRNVHSHAVHSGDEPAFNVHAGVCGMCSVTVYRIYDTHYLHGAALSSVFFPIRVRPSFGLAYLLVARVLGIGGCSQIWQPPNPDSPAGIDCNPNPSDSGTTYTNHTGRHLDGNSGHNLMCIHRPC